MRRCRMSVLDQDHVDCLDSDANCIADLEPQLIDGIQGHHRFHVGPSRDLHLDLAHDAAALDLDHSTLQLVANTHFHNLPSVRCGKYLSRWTLLPLSVCPWEPAR